jgi:hypothetical protein
MVNLARTSTAVLKKTFAMSKAELAMVQIPGARGEFCADLLVSSVSDAIFLEQNQQITTPRIPGIFWASKTRIAPLLC